MKFIKSTLLFFSISMATAVEEKGNVVKTAAPTAQKDAPSTNAPRWLQRYYGKKPLVGYRKSLLQGMADKTITSKDIEEVAGYDQARRELENRNRLCSFAIIDNINKEFAEKFGPYYNKITQAKAAILRTWQKEREPWELARKSIEQKIRNLENQRVKVDLYYASSYGHEPRITEEDVAEEAERKGPEIRAANEQNKLIDAQIDLVKQRRDDIDRATQKAVDQKYESRWRDLNEKQAVLDAARWEAIVSAQASIDKAESAALKETKRKYAYGIWIDHLLDNYAGITERAISEEQPDFVRRMLAKINLRNRDVWAEYHDRGHTQGLKVYAGSPRPLNASKLRAIEKELLSIPGYSEQWGRNIPGRWEKDDKHTNYQRADRDRLQSNFEDYLARKNK